MHDPLPLAASTLFPGPARDALTAAIAALELAEQRRQPTELCQALAQVSRCYRDVGLQEMAEGYLQQALRWAQALDATDQSVDLLCEAAELSLLRGSPERAREQAEEAARLARRTADPAWELAVLMRASDVLDRLGEHGQAIALHCRALSLIAQDHLHEPQTLPAPLAQPAFSTTLM